MSFLFGKPSSSGQMVNEQTAMQPLFQTIHLPSAGLQYSLGAFAQLKILKGKLTMANELQIFIYEGNEVRTVQKDGEV